MGGNIIKKIITFILSFLIIFSTLSFEKNITPEIITTFAKNVFVSSIENSYILNDNIEEKIGDKVLKVGDNISTIDSTAVVSFDGFGEIRLDNNSSLVFEGEFENGYYFNLLKGRAWINNLYTSSFVNVRSGNALFMPKHAIFDIYNDGSSSVVRVVKNYVNVGLINDYYESKNLIFYKNSTLINSFLMSEGTQSSIYFSKIVNNFDVLNKLLYSKLIKEFQYSILDYSKFIDDSWVKFNLNYDIDLFTNVESSKKSGINYRGLKFSQLDSVRHRVDDFLNVTADLLTFSEDKRYDRFISNIFDYLLDAEYLLIYGRNSEAMERLNLFSLALTDVFSVEGVYFKNVVLNKLKYHYANLNYVMPDNNLFLAREEVSRMLYFYLDDSDDNLDFKLELVRDYMNFVYYLVDKDFSRSQIMLLEYSKKISQYISVYRSKLGNMKYLISEDNQIMDNLLKRYPDFYQDSFFELKHYLESEWLKMLPDGIEKQEEQQTIISTKIDFLKLLQSNFLDQKISLNDAKKISLRLINEIQDLQPNSVVGVSDLFALRLKDYGNFLLFLNSTDVASLRNSSPQKEYDKFLALQKEQISISEAISQFFGSSTKEQLESQRIDLIMQQALSEFDKVGFKNVNITPITSTNQKYIDIKSAKFNEITFSARYDWDNKQISQVMVDEKIISYNPIRISNIELLLSPKSSNVTTDDIKDKNSEILDKIEVSKAEKVAKILLMQKLRINDISVLEENVSVADSVNQIYIVNGAKLVSDSNIQLAFVFDNKEDVVSSITIRTSSGDYKMPSSFSLSEVSSVVKSTYKSLNKSGEFR